MAARFHADSLVDRAYDELKACGLRPRRSRLSGVDALTGAELRVARMAAEGKSNREIAQGLFLTTKTVESHLSRTYSKLEIPGRLELSSKLGSPEEMGALSEV